MKKRKFKDLYFFMCYDCGWGEKGVSETYLTFDQAYEIIKTQAGKDCADEWAITEDEYLVFNGFRYMVAKPAFVEFDWVGE